MDEDKILDETVETTEETSLEVAGGEEYAAEETSVEETLEETAVEEAEGETAVGEATGDVAVTSNTEAIRPETPAVSKKTTAVLISIIAVLVAVIAVFVVLFVKDYIKDKQETPDVNDSVITDMNNNDVPVVTAEPSAPVAVDYHVDVELGQYVGIEVDYELAEVTDEEVQEQIDYSIKDFAEEIEVTDRPIQNGDVANIDYTGYINDVAFDRGADTDFDLEIGSGTFIDGFEEGLIGHNVGETVDVEVTFPENYGSEELAGKDALFVVVINSITAYKDPELTDEFVQENFDYESVEAYRASVREELEGLAAEDAEAKAQADIFDIVIANATFSGEIEEEIAAYAQDYKDYNESMAQSYYGIDGATLFSYIYGISADEYDNMIYEQSEYSVKYGHIMDKIAETEKFDITDEEYEQAFEEMFYDYYGFTTKEEVLQQITQEQIDEMVNSRLLRDKAEKFVIDNAIINK